MLVGLRREINPKLTGQRQQQGMWFKIRVRDVRRDKGFVQGRQEAAAQQRLASADFAGDLDKAFTVLHRHQQRVERLLMTCTGVGKTGVGSDAEGLFLQAEVRLIHEVGPRALRDAGSCHSSRGHPNQGLAALDGSGRRINCTRSLTSCACCCHAASPLISVTLSRITSSLLAS